MCQTCQSLEQKAQIAAAEGNAEKARVMLALLASHQRDHPVVTWKSGVMWVVGVG